MNEEVQELSAEEYKKLMMQQHRIFTKRNMRNKLQFAKWLRNTMEEKKVTVTELEELALLAGRKIRGLLLNQRSPTLEEMYAITKALNADITVLLKQLVNDYENRL